MSSTVGARPRLVLGPLLRWVDRDSATIWLETSAACTVSVLGHDARTFRIHGRFYALVVVDGLERGSTVPYEVHLDGHRVWPTADTAGPTVIRTNGSGRPVRVLVGSCRAAAPHEAPYTQELALDAEGRGVDTLWAHAHRMASQGTESWPALVVFAGDQIYADDSSPKARERIEQRRAEGLDLASEMVYSYEEYCWLYHEAWSEPAERWLLSVVPSTMIFDDHDMVDDWNISAAWLDDTAQDPTWAERAVNGFMSYWVYQHLGNLSPVAIRDEGLLDRLVGVDDGTDILRAWAQHCFDTAGSETPQQFSHVRQVDDVTVVTIDCRSARVLDERRRSMVQPNEWDAIVGAADAADGHLMLVTSVPVYVPDGIHDLHVWNARVCHGAWGRFGRRFGERVRRGLDLEDWPAFPDSFAEFQELIEQLRTKDRPPESIIVMSGDIHFGFAAPIGANDRQPGPPVWQIVSSPIRNALIPHERSAMRLATTRVGAAIGAILRRVARGADTRPGVRIAAGPFFANNMCEVGYLPEGVTVVFEQSTSADDGEDPELHVVGCVVLDPASAV